MSQVVLVSKTNVAFVSREPPSSPGTRPGLESCHVRVLGRGYGEAGPVFLGDEAPAEDLRA